jgi:predicted kinase
MVILINGSFGVGKTTVARLLRDALPGSVIYDPEWAGFVLRRRPRRGRRSRASDDFFSTSNSGAGPPSRAYGCSGCSPPAP